jgi:hypothetical protein
MLPGYVQPYAFSRLIQLLASFDLASISPDPVFTMVNIKPKKSAGHILTDAVQG